MLPTKPYIVCATQRSGSTLLCEALQSTGVAGQPDEFLEPTNVRRWTAHLRTSSPAGYLAALRARRSSANGVFGLKLMFPDLVAFIAASGKPIDHAAMADQVDSLLPGVSYLWLTRRNKIRQAVSYLRAVQTDVWQLRDRATSPPGQYSYDGIRTMRQYIVTCEGHWRSYFRAGGIRPLVIEYESFTASYSDTVSETLEHLRLPHRPVGPPTLRRQADVISDAWVERFHRDDARRDGADVDASTHGRQVRGAAHVRHELLG